MNKEQQKEFKETSEKMMNFISKNFHPHTKVIIDRGNAEIVEGIFNHANEAYLQGTEPCEGCNKPPVDCNGSSSCVDLALDARL